MFSSSCFCCRWLGNHHWRAVTGQSLFWVSDDNGNPIKNGMLSGRLWQKCQQKEWLLFLCGMGNRSPGKRRSDIPVAGDDAAQWKMGGIRAETFGF